MANSVTPTNPGSQSGRGTNTDTAITQMNQAFDRAIAKAAEVSAERQEAGAALDAARTRLSN